MEYNQSIRERLWGDAKRPIQPLLVNRSSSTHALCNGDLIKVLDVEQTRERYEVSFRGGKVVNLDFRNAEVAYRKFNGTVVKLHCFLLAKVRHPWTNGQVERIGRTIKEATVKRFHYHNYHQPGIYLTDFINAYNHARQLKTLSSLTLYEYICKMWTNQPEKFILNPTD